MNFVSKVMRIVVISMGANGYRPSMLGTLGMEPSTWIAVSNGGRRFSHLPAGR